jgi:hypothetical protein
LNDGEVCDIGIKITRNSLEVSRMALGRNAYQTELESNPFEAQFCSCNVFSGKEMANFLKNERFYTCSELLEKID